jgi:hypothetical protein
MALIGLRNCGLPRRIEELLHHSTWKSHAPPRDPARRGNEGMSYEDARRVPGQLDD